MVTNVKGAQLFKDAGSTTRVSLTSSVTDVRHFTPTAELAGVSAGLISKKLKHKMAAALKMEVELRTDDEEVNRNGEYKQRM